jgi:hypothetical protein
MNKNFLPILIVSIQLLFFAFHTQADESAHDTSAPSLNDASKRGETSVQVKEELHNPGEAFKSLEKLNTEPNTDPGLNGYDIK